ncbi:S41 family peptidase [Pseudoalteromonas sp. SSDWG2]|uniref:S41 family peptidase n=1 Tax=Pseudoalteromonas sp. SSDWG2 TaxID=3139391 RepID=UPI003BAD9098
MKRMKKATIALILSFASAPVLAKPITEAQQQEVITKITQLMSDKYVFPEMAAHTNKKLTAALKNGEFSNYLDDEEFADALSTWLQQHAEDRHLRVKANPVQKDVKGAESRLHQKLTTKARFDKLNQGVVEAKVFADNIGYLDLRGFSHLSHSKTYIDSAMQLLANSDAVIIDLRKNGGGSPRTVQYLCSYFFDEPLLLNSLYFREGDETRDFYVLDEVNGKKMPDVPLYVLTSNKTFSGAEEFSYNMQTRDRATLIGTTTGGGANPGGMFTIDENFRMFIATGTAINPVTKTNWESVGVKPDVEVAADEALDKALELATAQVNESWSELKAQREVQSQQLLQILDNVKSSSDSIEQINAQYQQKVVELVTQLQLGDRDLAMLAHERWQKSPHYAAFLFEIAVDINDKETFLYEFWARSLAKMGHTKEAQQIISVGIDKVEGDEHITMLKEALAEITSATKTL